jgi:osmotically-inducible protein OsmY
VVVLRGEVADSAMSERLEHGARAIPGVWEVENLLHLPGEPAPTHR